MKGDGNRITMLDLTIIIPSYNTKELLRKCIKSIYTHTSGISYEIICVDDNSPDCSAEMVSTEFPDVILVRNRIGQKYAKNNNLGMRMSRARYACLLNSDTLLKDNAFKLMIHFMDTHTDAAACGPRLLNPDMTVQSCIRKFPGLFTMLLQGVNWHKVFPNGSVAKKYYASDFDYSRETAVESIGTTAFVIRRETWETAGMLDERFPHYQVDIAYNLMLKRKKYKVFYTPAAEIIHYGSQSMNQMPRQNIIELHRALEDFSDYYDYFGSSPIVKWLVRWLLRIRCRIKLIEYRLSRDKRVIKGPGAPSFKSDMKIAKVTKVSDSSPRENDASKIGE